MVANIRSRNITVDWHPRSHKSLPRRRHKTCGNCSTATATRRWHPNQSKQRFCHKTQPQTRNIPKQSRHGSQQPSQRSRQSPRSRPATPQTPRSRSKAPPNPRPTRPSRPRRPICTRRRTRRQTIKPIGRQTPHPTIRPPHPKRNLRLTNQPSKHDRRRRLVTLSIGRAQP